MSKWKLVTQLSDLRRLRISSPAMNHRLRLQKILVSEFVEPHIVGRSTALLKESIVTIKDERLKRKMSNRIETLTSPGLNLDVHDVGKFFAEPFKRKITMRFGLKHYETTRSIHIRNSLFL